MGGLCRMHTAHVLCRPFDLQDLFFRLTIDVFTFAPTHAELNIGPSETRRRLTAAGTRRRQWPSLVTNSR